MPRYEPVALADGDMLAVGQPTARMLLRRARRLCRSARDGQLRHRHPGPCRPGARGRGRLAGGAARASTSVVAAPELPPADLPTLEQEVVLDVVMGPRTDWFTPEAIARFAAQRWRVTPQSNRVGLRLAGEQPLDRAITGELPSEGTALVPCRCPQRPARAVPGRPPAHGRLPGHRLRGAVPPRPAGRSPWAEPYCGSTLFSRLRVDAGKRRACARLTNIWKVSDEKV